MAVCDVCFRHCDIPEGGRGFCGARTCAGGRVVPENYGRVTALALDPVNALLTEICAAVSIPVTAIGGITAENAPLLKGTGIAGTAVVSAVFAESDIRKAAETLRALEVWK